MQTILELHRRAIDAVRPVVAKVGDLDLPTPCAGWDLRSLLAHMTGQDYGFAAAVLDDVTVEAFAPRDAAWEGGAAAVVEAFARADPERQVLMPEFNGMRFPLRMVVGFHLIDTLVHGWDVAVSIGVDVAYDDELVAAGLRQAELVPDGEVRTAPGAAFAPARAGADVLTGWPRALALLGRDPNWRP
jgi:uncharacterized protein (TIGR03086 family)